jgi:hypothetical protein
MLKTRTRKKKSRKRYTIAMSMSGCTESSRTQRTNAMVVVAPLLIANHQGNLQSAFVLPLLRGDSIPHPLPRLVFVLHHPASCLATLLSGCVLHHLLA